MYKTTFSIFFFIAIIVNISLGQGQLPSVYSKYNIGDVNYSPLIRNNAMGGVSYTLISNNNINFVNPAGIANIDTLTFIFDFGVNGGLRQYSTSDPARNIIKSDHQISYANFGFSAAKWWKIALGIVPYSNVNFNIKESTPFDTISINNNYIGRGGVTRVYWANAFVPFKKIPLKIGINSSFLFGKITHESSFVFSPNYNDANNLTNYYSEESYRISSFNFEAGIQYDLKINENHKLLFGAVSNFKNNLRAYKSAVEYSKNPATSIQDTINNIDEKKGKVTLPLNAGLGLGYLFKDKLYVGVDAKYQNWSKAAFFGQSDSLDDCFSFAAGLEYVPGGYDNISSYKYWQAMRFRFGLYYNQSYYNIINTQYPIDDFGITFGICFPLKRSRTNFDLSFKFGQRGTTENSLIRERYFITGISFNLSDIWFVKSKFD